MKYAFRKKTFYGNEPGYWEVRGNFLATVVSGRLENFQRLGHITQTELLKKPVGLQYEMMKAIKKA